MPRPSSYLGTPQRQVSDSRISRINKLFEARLRDDSMVVSNNSTSVMNDICQPVNLPEDTTIKHNRFPDFQPLESRSSSEEYMLDDSSRQDRNNVQFTPKLRSKQSIVEFSKTSTPRNESRAFKKKALKDILGNPLPLPYLGKRNNVLPGKDLNSRWKTIISNTKPIETKPSSSKDYYRFGTKVRHTNADLRPGNIEDRLKENTQKLDEIIDLLKKSGESPRHNPYEPLMWLTCIILLTFCNVWVYYYLQ